MFGRLVGDGQPCLVIAEAGVNHNGREALALALVDAAATAGADVVKFQKRSPELAVPVARWHTPRESCTAPVGTLIGELAHRQAVEFGRSSYERIAERAALRGVSWFASPWDAPSVDFLESLGAEAYKVPSARVTDHALLRRIAETAKPVILSTGMSDLDDVERALRSLHTDRVVLLHSCSAYPMNNEDANLRAMHTLAKVFGLPVGWSGHERGLQISIAAIALGACVVERHITLDRSMRGSDHAASLEPDGFRHLVRDIRAVEAAMGDGVKVPRPCEEVARERLRRAS